MSRLTLTEKQQLGAKVEGEKERQRMRRMNPNTPVASAEADFIFSHLYKYGMLAIALYLLAASVMHLLKWQNFIQPFLDAATEDEVMHLLKWQNFAYDQYGNLVIALMLFFNHIAYSFTKTGWKNRVMRAVAWIWMVLGFVYIFWVA